MQPILIIPPEQMSHEDMEVLRKNGICVVVAKDPATIKFLDPIPAASNRTKIEDAAIQLSRRILHGDWSPGGSMSKGDAAQLYIQALIKGTPLEKTTQAEREQEVFDQAKAAELRRIAAEEAREERKLAKEQRETAKAKEKSAKEKQHD